MWSSIRNWIEPIIPEYNKRGIDVTVVCNMDNEFESYLNTKYPYLHTCSFPFPRGANVFGSIKSIFFLKKFFRSQKFDLVQYSTPNASFYASVASKAAKIQKRLYCQWGMVFISQKGIKRLFYKLIEKKICKESTIIQPDSFGNLEYCRKHHFYSAENSHVIWNGSAKGLDLTKYDLTKKQEYCAEIKNRYDIPTDSMIVGFVGRLGKEKGCNELFSAFKKLKNDFPTLKLLFVGPIEKEKTIDKHLLNYFKTCPDIIATNRVSDVEKHISAMDIFVLPSYREGFGMSVIEASAMEVPVICTKYPGPSSAIMDGKTGLLIEPKNENELYSAIKKLILNNELRKELGKNGRVFVETHFEQKQFIKELMNDRMSILGQDFLTK